MIGHERAAREVLDLAGDLTLLRSSGASVFRCQEGIVRVDRGGADRVRVGAALAAAGAPVPTLLAGPFEHGGLVVSLTREAPDDGVADPEAMGRALAAFHAVGGRLLAEGAITVPVWDPVDWLERWLAAVPEAGLGTELAARVRALAPCLRGPTTLLHTDAHAGNFRCAAGSAVLVDLEQLSTGPVLYDLAPLEVTERRFRGDRATFERFARAAGHDPADLALAPLIALREVLAVGFVLGLGHVDVARRRLDDLDHPHEHWAAF